MAKSPLLVPHDVQILSFDNAWIGSYPITSVDGGYGRLGFDMFHILKGDISIPLSRKNMLLERPFVNHRGSLGGKN